MGRALKEAAIKNRKLGIQASLMSANAFSRTCIVTPADLSQRPRELLHRLEALAVSVTGIGCALAIGHADRSSPADAELRRRLGRLAIPGVHLVSQSPQSEAVNLARMRNTAMQAVSADIVVLLDADIVPDARLLCALSGEVAAGAPLAMAPCLYLSRAGNRLVTRPGGKEAIIRRAFAFSNEFITHWALPSSVMAVRRSDYLALGGFHEAYVGHGYEDFDFMLRLALHVGLIEPRTGLLVDRAYRAPLLSEGFRAALGRLCIPHLLDGHLAFHFHHVKDRHSGYQRRRTENAEIFRRRLTDWLSPDPPQGEYDETLETLRVFFSECASRGKDPAQFHALFDARPRHLVNPVSWWTRIRRAMARALP